MLVVIAEKSRVELVALCGVIRIFGMDRCFGGTSILDLPRTSYPPIFSGVLHAMSCPSRTKQCRVVSNPLLFAHFTTLLYSTISIAEAGLVCVDITTRIRSGCDPCPKTPSDDIHKGISLSCSGGNPEDSRIGLMIGFAVLDISEFRFGEYLDLSRIDMFWDKYMNT